MSFKVCLIGTANRGFISSRQTLLDLACIPEFHDIEVSFFDINEENLQMALTLAQRDIDANGLDIRLTATTNRREAFQDAKYFINVARFGGIESSYDDFNIPMRYGVDQCVGDTLCVGGIMYAQRGIPHILDICRDIREVGAPDPLLLNFANPNPMIVWAAVHDGGVNSVGICHGVMEGTKDIAKALHVPKEELDIVCAGINHQTWYISVKHNGEEVTGKLLEAFENHKELCETEKVRIDMMRRFGYFSTESNGHLSEYLPWYRKNPEDLKQWIYEKNWLGGPTAGSLNFIKGFVRPNWKTEEYPQWLAGDPILYTPDKRGTEHTSYIIESLETGRLYRGNLNVVNNGCIPNLPKDAIVEVPCYIDGNGINVPRVGNLPLGCAAVCNASISVQRLAVKAAVEGDDMLLRQSMMMDPLTGAVCNPPEIWQMVDELLIAQEEWLPQYGKAAALAKERWAKAEKDGTLIPPRKGVYQFVP